MAKPDGRIERGQSIKKAFSANKWNDLCDAADIVHGRRGGIKADPATFKGLPCQIGTFETETSFGRAYHVSWSATTDDEGKIPSLKYPSLVPVPLEPAYASGQSGEKIVIGHPSDKHSAVYSGFAAALVQVTNYTHKFARAPIGGGSFGSANFTSGILQSAFHGPVQIVGYFSLNASTTPNLTTNPDTTATLVYPNYELVWALVWI